MSDKKPTPEEEKAINKSHKESKGNKQTLEEFGGTKGPEPTRYGDWEHGGRCTDF